MENGKQPLLPSDELEAHNHGHGEARSSSISGLFFSHGTEDIAPIKDAGGFLREFSSESKKLWSLAGPAIFTSIGQFLVNSVPVFFAGHVSTLTLAALSIGNTVLSGFVYGIMVLKMIYFYIKSYSVYR